MQASSSAPCPNCGAAPTGRYCADCGQDLAHLKLHVRSLMAEGLRNFFGWDGAAPRTVRGLLRDPGSLAAAYVRGERKRHLNPARFCFVTAALWVFLARQLDIDPMIASGFSFSGESTKMAAAAEKLKEFISTNLDVILFVSLPVRAAANRVLFKGSGRSLADCLVLVLYVAGLSFAAGILFSFMERATGIAGLGRFRTLVGLAYTVYAARTFFDTGWWPATWRSLVALFVHMLGTIAIGAALALPFVFQR